ncbi:hypothetical protein V2W30_22560 [Streptomyces sp. Q6]|uniref:Uncharacterized protein n=1 Tax=Streptomyces citrinus TaxID=3118173 RepID=A0ACD5AF47_9ACTN
MAHRAMPGRARRVLRRIFRRTPTRTTRPVAPLWVRILTDVGRPIVLAVALLMCAPGEYHLARTAGWNTQFAYGMPVVLSAYAGIAATVASTRRRGDRGRWSAILGACLALGLAMAAQVVSHLIGTGHLAAKQGWLVAVTSLVPPAVVGHLLHLAATPPDTRQDTQDAPEAPAVLSVPAAPAAPLVICTADLRLPDGQDDDKDAQDDEHRPPPPPVLLSTAEIADRYGVDPSTIRSWVASGRLYVHTKDARGRNWFADDASVPAAREAVAS